MTTSLYTVTLTDLGSYTVTVAAHSTKEACSIAKTILCDQVTELPPELQVVQRDIEAVASIAETQPTQTYEVHANYSIDFSITVPAFSSEEAERHAKRIYDLNPIPHEYDMRADLICWEYAEEVQS